MGVVMGNLGSFLSGLDKDVVNINKAAGNLIEKTVFAVHESLVSKTPVYTGQTVRNYIWTKGNPYSGTALEAIDNGPTGITSGEPLGGEARRAPNEDSAKRTLNALSFAKPYSKYIVTNKSPAVFGLERGELPGNGKKSRSPNGMFLITETAINSKIKSGIIK